MLERPILMSTSMVRACLRQVDPKTQTRRVVRGEECPYGQAGVRLWVREAAKLRSVGPERGEVTIGYRADDELGGLITSHVLADGEKCPYQFTRWTPGIHMPRWACRLLLEVVDVRSERVQSISYADLLAEGFEKRADIHSEEIHRDAARDWYADLWDSLNAARGYSWRSNPWVWVVEFKRVAA